MLLELIYDRDRCDGSFDKDMNGISPAGMKIVFEMTEETQKATHENDITG